MIPSEGQEINEKIFDKLNEIELKKFSKKVDLKRPEQVLNSFPSTEILPEEKAILHLKKETDLDEGTIISSLKILIKDKKIITASDSKGRIYFSKMRKLY